MIIVEDIQRRFGSVVAVRGVSLRAENGVVTALLGPNGAGKTTTLRMMTGLIPPDAGSIRVDDVDVRVNPIEARRRLGALTHAHGLYPRLTPREHIRYFGRLQGLSEDVISRRTTELAQLLEMNDFVDRRAEGFSQGQKLKVALARALVHDPQNVVLDEPTAGLDVKGIRALRELIRALKQQGRAVIFSTHVMQEVAALCDAVVVIARGSVVASGTIDDVMRSTDTVSLEDAFVKAIGDTEGLA